MTPFALNLEKTTTTVAVNLEPARNVIASMVMLTKDEDVPGISNWIAETRDKMTKKQKFQHKLVTVGFYYILAVDQSWNTFDGFLSQLAQTDALILQNKLRDAYVEMCFKKNGDKSPASTMPWEEAIASADNYIKFLLEGFGVEHVDEELERKAWEYVIDPPAMKAMILEHLTWAWETFFKKEWERVEGMLKESVRAFQQNDFTKMDRLEAARFVTGHDLTEEGWRPALENAEQLIFIPNAHIGPYISRLPDTKSLVVVFGARTPENATVRIPDLDRADIVTRLSALADDTRLQILQMIQVNGEMRAQEIMDAFSLSQPSVSRYLGQLSATGYLQERRVNGAKVYALNRERISKTLSSVRAFLLGSN